MSYATPEEAATPCPASYTTPAHHKWMPGHIELIPVGVPIYDTHTVALTEQRMITAMCEQCLLELHNMDFAAWRALLIASAEEE